MRYKAIVDCNSFYCSCERVFRPDLFNQPVAVLSNNDGCIISRSDEAKKLGVGMAVPYHQNKELILRNRVEIFSSNYVLYGDMSRRVMETLRIIAGAANVEVYSVDEAFIDLQDMPLPELSRVAHNLRAAVEQWTGIQVSVGVAPTKTLAKLANLRAKKEKEKTNCVLILDTEEKTKLALMDSPVGEIWGIGHKSADRLIRLGIHTGWQLRNMNEEWIRKNLGGVVGVRLLRELRGQESIVMEDALDNKKMIATTRMFGSPVKDLCDIREAIATYTSRAAEKLRRQQSAASIVNVFVVPKEPRTTPNFQHTPSIGAHAVLTRPTSLTHELIKAATQLVEQVFQNNRFYQKAGVVLSGLVPDDSIQSNLFHQPAQNNHRQLMSMIDNINFSMRDDTLKFAASGTQKNWKMRQELRSPRYSTRWDELPIVIA